MTERRTTITIGTLADHPQLVPEVVDIAWREWGGSLARDERARWLREAERDSRLHLPTSAGFVAVDGDRAVGTVQLHEYEIDAIRDRSPWVCGMLVLPDYRGAGVGSQLLAALERFAAGHGVPRLWVFTEHAAGVLRAMRLAAALRGRRAWRARRRAHPRPGRASHTTVSRRA